MLLHWALGADNDDSGEADDIAGQCSGHGGNDNGDVSFPKAPPPFFLFNSMSSSPLFFKEAVARWL